MAHLLFEPFTLKIYNKLHKLLGFKVKNYQKAPHKLILVITSTIINQREYSVDFVSCLGICSVTNNISILERYTITYEKNRA